MHFRYLTNSQNAPSLFTFHKTLGKKDLRRGSFCLYTEDINVFINAHNPILKKLIGLIISPGDEDSFVKVNNYLWHITISPENLPSLGSYITVYSELLSCIHNEKRNHERVKLEWGRSATYQNRLKDFYSSTQKKVQQDLMSHHKWTNTALTKMITLTTDILQSVPFEEFRYHAGHFLLDSFFSYSTVALYRNDGSFKELDIAGDSVINLPEIEGLIKTPYQKKGLLLIPFMMMEKSYLLSVLNKNSEYVFTDYEIHFLELFSHVVASQFTIRVTQYKLREQRDKAEAANKAKDQFLANVSHELRTPLNGITGMADLLGSSNLDPKQKELIEILKNCTSTLSTIINDILDFSKIKAGILTIQSIPFVPSELCESTLSLFKVQAMDKGIEIKKKFTPIAHIQHCGDPMRIQQILVNLLSNAIKFTKTGTIEIEIKEHSCKEIDGVMFAVHDTGMGFHQDNKNLIFESFKQLDQSYTKSYQGTGLGLAIAKHLTGMMNGKIDAESILSKGSTFYFILPLEKVSDEKNKKITSPGCFTHPELSGKKILIAEDEVINMMYIENLISRTGASMDFASNGREVLDLLHEQTYDLILMDIGMPELNGLDCTRLIRNGEIPGKEDIPIIALTGYIMDEDIANMKKAGISLYAAKPIQQQLLYEKIDSLFNGQKPDL